MLDRIRDGRTDLVFAHLNEGHPASAADSGGVSLIQWCAYYGDVSAIRHLITHGETLTALGDDLGLNAAAYHGHWQLCEYLIENGADPSRPRAGTGETPLHAALCKANRPQYDLVVRVLLAANATPNVATKPGVPTDGFMRDTRTKGETPLHRAAAFGSEEAVRMLLDAGAVIDARDASGDTPLAWASWHLRPAAIIRMLGHSGQTLHASHRWTGDHGAGWGGLDAHLLGKPHGKRA